MAWLVSILRPTAILLQSLMKTIEDLGTESQTCLYCLKSFERCYCWRYPQVNVDITDGTITMLIAGC